MDRLRALIFAVATAAASSPLAASTARADDRATAQRLFEEGQKLFKDGQTADACSKFEGAAALVNSPGVRLNLARCYEKLGRTASAWTKYDEAQVAAERVGDRTAATAARQGRAALEPKLSKIVIAFSNGPVAGVEIARDGETLPPSVVGSEMPVDPGDHEVAARASGFKSWSTHVTVGADAATVRVAIPPLEPEPAATPPAPGTVIGPAAATTAETPLPAQGHGSTLGIAGIATGAVGVVGLGLGTYFAVTASSKWHQANRSGNTCLDAACPALTQQASNAATLSTVFFVGGAVLAGAGVTMWVLSLGNHSTEHASIQPVLGPGIAGLAMGGSFR